MTVNTSMTTKQQIIGLVVWVLISFVASAIGAIASVQAAEFYGQLDQPSWAPPSWLFGPVWTILYAMMGVAAWLVWRCGGVAINRTALALFIIQLAVNGLWSWLFFAWNMGGLAVLNIIILWVMIVATGVMFWRVDKWAGMLLIPYLAWVSFATALNYTVWQLNPQILG